jgi:DNA-binding transcriptional LysR family regulator
LDAAGSGKGGRITVSNAETAPRAAVVDWAGDQTSVEGDKPKLRSEMTLRQLRIFWAVAHAETLTKASKQLGLTQPSMSQQLSKMEKTVGARLFHRTRNRMMLTDAGRFLLRKAEIILGNVEEVEDGLREFRQGVRANIRVAGVNSVLRVLLPSALRLMEQDFPDLELDIHEAAPADALELLYGRRVNVGLVASNSIAQASVGFHQTPVAEDPYVLAVPAGLSLADISDPDAELEPAERKVINSCIQFAFGTQHTRRVEQWYSQVLPHHRLIASCRSYEVALAMVEAGLGVCLVPAFTAFDGQSTLAGVRFYRSTEPSRRIVALQPTQYQRVEPFRSFVDALRQAGSAVRLPDIAPSPPFLSQSLPKVNSSLE